MWLQTISHTRKHTKWYAAWCWSMISFIFTILPPFTSNLYRTLVKGGKIVNQELIILQHRVAYRFVCFPVWQIIWNHFQTHRTTSYRVISVISLITSDSLSKWGRYWHISFFGATIKLFGIKYWLGPCPAHQISLCADICPINHENHQ